MNIASYFIHRPVAAMVLSILTLIVGVLALTALPISQYPDVVPPQVVVTAVYPGQSAQKVADEVASPIEEQINGVENMLYMESQCTNDGAMRLTITFANGTDPDKAQVLVQNRVGIATPKLPDVVKNIGVITKKQSSAILLVVTMYSDDSKGEAKFTQLDVSNYAKLNVKDELARIQGVGDVFMFGEREYSMRVWLDPMKLSDYQLNPSDVTRAIREQNIAVATGTIGAPPAPSGQNFQFTVNTQGRLLDAAAFENIVVKSIGTEQLVRLKDVVRDPKTVNGTTIRGVELGARSYDSNATLDGRPSVGMPIFQLPGGNAFDTAQAIQRKMTELRSSKSWPDGMEYAIVFNPTTFVQDSVNEVVKTLIEAIVLVAIVVLVFLQNWRAAIIPMLAVPVALIGTLAAMYALGYSINNLTLFGMVLAIGIVVDDAIVVVEAVESHMAKGLAPLAATEEAMKEVSSAIIGVSLVLAAVFLPATVIPGITGQFFRQFAVVMAVSTLLSAFNSLTLSPALCPLLLKPHAKPGEHHHRDPIEWLTHVLLGWWFFKGFNWFFEKITNLYGYTIAKMLRVSVLVMLVYFGLLALTGWAFSKLPGGFIPQQDQGYLVVNVQLPDGASVERSAAVVRRIDEICLGPIGPDGKRDSSKGIKGIDHVKGLAGYSIFASANISNAGGAYLSLSPFEHRKGRHANVILAELNAKLAEIQEGRAQAFGAPPILGLGNAGGFKMQVKDVNNLGPGVLEGMTWNLCFAAMRERGIPAAFSNYTSGGPVLAVTIDTDRCFRLGVSDKDVKDAMQVYLGSLYVNDVTLLNRNWQVNVMADATFRSRKDDIGKLKVRSSSGEMVSIGGLVQIVETNGPTKVNRYNMKPAADLNGFTIPFLISSGDALAKMEQIAARDLPAGLDFEWTEMAYQQSKAANTVVRIPGVFEFKGDTTLLVFGLSTVLAFLILAFLYESFLLPLAVVMIVPMCLLAAAVGLMVTMLDLNIFTQIGLVVLVGLASKNAILIVEFAKQKREEGMPRWEAAVAASRSRLRPILMTSFAFILGVLPLVIATGAGAEMRRALGTAVFAGMIGVTIFGLFLTPIFYVLLQRLRDRG